MFASAVIAALSLKAPPIDPFATVALIQVYDKVGAGQSPDPEWTARLESMSGKLRELTHQARDMPAAAPPAAAASPGA